MTTIIMCNMFMNQILNLNKMKINWDLIGAIFFTLILYSCIILFLIAIKPKAYYKIVEDKAAEESTGIFSDIEYVITYEDGTYSYVSFGKYNTLEKGDTVWFNNYKNYEKE